MTRPTVNLSEWEDTGEPTRGSPLYGKVLAENSEAQHLAKELNQKGGIEILELAGGLELRASSFVGRFSLGDLMVTIRPKISGLPLMNLLRYAYRLRHLDLFTEVGYAAESASFEDLLIYQLAAETSELISRGLHRDYLRTISMLTSPRGRIHFGDYAQVIARAGVALSCVHHPRSEDNKINRALHGGLELAAGMTLDRELGERVRRLAKSIVPNITPIKLDVTGFEEAWHSLDRRTGIYKPALTLIKMLLNTLGAALTDDSPNVAASGFLFDMNRFFQALLSRFLAENLHDYDVHDENNLRGVFAYDPANNPRHCSSPKLRPDFMVMLKGKVAAVIDAKYRDLWETNLPREMLYQLALYAMGQETIERRSIILYPTLDDAARQQIIFIKNPLIGTTKAQVILRPVKLIKLEQMLLGKDIHAQSERAIYAHQLVFGLPNNVSTN